MSIIPLAFNPIVRSNVNGFWVNLNDISVSSPLKLDLYVPDVPPMLNPTTSELRSILLNLFILVDL